ncbi:lytic murein transglycosylase [Candidatus Parcubacteria bacterium]|nr:lytic murein transglycosylase [Candidatus Parcubacteria bacterium]
MRSYYVRFGLVGMMILSLTFVSLQIAPRTASSETVEEKEARLRAELDEVTREIAEQQKILEVEMQKGQSIARDIAILTAQINEAKLNIRKKNLAIEGLGKDINSKTKEITILADRIDENRESLAQLIRKTNEMDTYTLVDVMLSNSDISEFFSDVDAFDTIKEGVQVNLGYIKQSKSETEVARQSLDKKRLEEINQKISIEVEKAKIEKNEKEKAYLLSLSKKEQQNYQTQIKSKEQKAAQIRAALFALRDTAAIPFGKALEFATKASQATGVRPAFLLGILTQESNLGKNVGSCYLTDPATGDGKRISTGAFEDGVMKPSRDVQPFLQITSELGRDPYTTRVSCPFSTGYGGAMGPSQFIPSTWMLFKARIAKALGVGAPDPWEPEHAFMASAIYLSDLGAGGGDYASERNAACRYYSGRACDSKAPANKFYGDQVMTKANDIQVNMIDPLAGI